MEFTFHGDLQEDVYMTLPLGISSSKPNQVCKLLKSLYGLKQASKKWFEKLHSILLQQNYIQAHSDHSLLIKKIASSFTVLLVYVDDIIVAGDSLTEIDHIKSILRTSFEIKNLGQLKYFLGLEVAHSQHGISLCQRKYCLDILLVPNITFITQQLSKFLFKPTQTHHHAALRLLRYLKGYLGKGLYFPRSSSLHLQGFSDAD